MCTEVCSTPDIDALVECARIIFEYFTEVSLECPCGSGLPMVQADACVHCLRSMQAMGETVEPFEDRLEGFMPLDLENDLYEDLTFDEVDGEIQLVE